MTKLLIVDDESLLRQGFMHMTNWTTHGFQIIGEAANGKEALEIIAQKSPDIVVTDIKMPVMDGIELTKAIKEKYPHLQVVILSSYNDFEYVRETLRLGAFDYILKPKMNFTDLLNVLQKASLIRYECNHTHNEQLLAEAREQFLSDLINNHTLSQTVIRDNFAKHRIQLAEENLSMLAVSFDSAQTALKNEERQLLLTAINASIDPSFNPVSFFDNSNQGVTIFNLPAASDQKILDQICAAIIATVKSHAAIDSQILAGTPFNGYLMIPETFHKLCKKTPYCFYFPKGQYRSITHFQTTSDYIAFDFRIINPLVDRFNFNELRSTVKSWVEEQISRENYLDPYILKKFFAEVCYLIIYKYVEIGLYWEEVNEKKFECLKTIENTTDYHSLMQAFTAILTDLEQFFTGHMQIKSNTIITEVIKYVHQNYDQDISLESTAKQFFIDKSYLCKLFKKHTKQNFNDYLMQIRINKAKELLTNPEYTVNGVSVKVGYSDYSYFGRVFKKIVGMTPSEFKKSINLLI